MRIAQIRPLDIANGKGIRCSIFISGCTHRCPGCFNEEYQDFEYGDLLNEEHINIIKEQLRLPRISGLTLLGGEPLQSCADLLLLLTELRDYCRNESLNKDVWLYSGYEFEEIADDPVKRSILDFVDILVDGKYVDALKDPSLAFRGSSNQRIIDVGKSLREQCVALLEL